MRSLMHLRARRLFLRRDGRKRARADAASDLARCACRLSSWTGWVNGLRSARGPAEPLLDDERPGAILFGYPGMVARPATLLARFYLETCPRYAERPAREAWDLFREDARSPEGCTTVWRLRRLMDFDPMETT